MRTPLIGALAGCGTVVLLAATPALAQQAVRRGAAAGEWIVLCVADDGRQNLGLAFRVTAAVGAGRSILNGAVFADRVTFSISPNTVHFKIDRLDFTGVIAGPTMKV